MKLNHTWHTLPPDEVMSLVGSEPEGLSQEEAQRRLAVDGPNALTERARRPPWLLLLDQFRSPLIAILMLSAVVAYFFGKGFDVWVILGIVLLNATIGFVLEHRAMGAIEALKRLTSPRARVLRDDILHDLPSSEVVVGDVLVLEAGDRVPADARLLSATELQLDESGLTGESMPVSKDPAPMAEPGLSLGDRLGMLYMHTAVVSGRARAVVVATGMDTEIGRIAEGVSEADSVAPIQRRLAKFGVSLSLAIVGIVLAVMGAGLLMGRPVGEMIYVAVSLAVAAIPEGLPLVVSALFAIGVTRMARRRALIRRLPAVEALGTVTLIASDKTGTLTRNEMTVRRLWQAGRLYEVTGEGYAPHGELVPAPPLEARGLAWLGACARLANNALLETEGHQWRVVGDPTEGALLTLASKLGVHAEWERGSELPFSSERKWMATLHTSPDGERIAFVKGAIERLVPMAIAWTDERGEERPLDEPLARDIAEAAEAMAQDALRVIAFGMVRGLAEGESLSVERLRGRLVLLGFVGMIDPPRAEALDAVKTCQKAGIRVVMITGDHATTAQAIARQLGILGPGQAFMEGAELEHHQDLRGLVEKVAVYARVDPAHKLRIVKAMQQGGHIVAMTGDGVNDAPALAQADIGIAMGITGTEVAKGAAAMVLADDHFATIVAAVEEGRAISGNLRRVVAYLLATCVANIVAIGAAIVTGLELPFTAVMLLWINLVATGVFDKSLALEQGEPDAMQRPPRPADEPLVDREALLILLVGGLIMAAGTLAAFTWALHRGDPIDAARTEAFTAMAAFQCFSAFTYRSTERSIFELPLNPWMLLSTALALLLQILAVYASPFQAVLGTVSLPAAQFAGAIAVGASLLVASELYKWLLRSARR